MSAQMAVVRLLSENRLSYFREMADFISSLILELLEWELVLLW